MNARGVVKTLALVLRDEPLICATGFIGRVVQEVMARSQNFYMMGSMGMASSIGLGMTLAKPGMKVVVLDGDGAVLMNLGNMPVVGALRPSSLIHLVIDNASYESTGGQPTYTKSIGLEKIAEASGYRYAKRVSTVVELEREINVVLKEKGPSFLLIRVDCDQDPPPPRIVDEPEMITKKFSESIGAYDC